MVNCESKLRLIPAWRGEAPAPWLILLLQAAVSRVGGVLPVTTGGWRWRELLLELGLRNRLADRSRSLPPGCPPLAIVRMLSERSRARSMSGSLRLADRRMLPGGPVDRRPLARGVGGVDEPLETLASTA
jgi:hypothetical protein